MTLVGWQQSSSALPETYIGERLQIVGEWKTLGECKQLYKEVTGKNPPRWPMPVWVLRRMQPELVKMWEWFRTLDDADARALEPVSAIYTDATDVRTFLRQKLSKQ